MEKFKIDKKSVIGTYLLDIEHSISSLYSELDTFSDKQHCAETITKVKSSIASIYNVLHFKEE